MAAREHLLIRDLAAQVVNNELSPEKLSKDQTLDVVEELWVEGAKNTAIARHLHCCERTIRRYKDAIKKRNALALPEGHAAIFVGSRLKDIEFGMDLMRTVIQKSGDLKQKKSCIVEFVKMNMKYTKLMYEIGYIKEGWINDVPRESEAKEESAGSGYVDPRLVFEQFFKICEQMQPFERENLRRGDIASLKAFVRDLNQVICEHNLRCNQEFDENPQGLS